MSTIEKIWGLMGGHGSGRQEAWFQLSLALQLQSGQAHIFICQMKGRCYPSF